MPRAFLGICHNLEWVDFTNSAVTSVSPCYTDFGAPCGEGWVMGNCLGYGLGDHGSAVNNSPRGRVTCLPCNGFPNGDLVLPSTVRSVGHWVSHMHNIKSRLTL